MFPHMNDTNNLSMYLSTASTLMIMACITNGSKGLFEPQPDPEQLTVLLLQDVGPQVVSPNLSQFSTKLTSLATSIDNHIQVLQDSNEVVDVSELQDEWTATMLQWQQLELMQIGPLGSYYDVIGGEDKRYELYSWPITNDCRVDMVTVERDYLMEDFFDGYQINVTGLDALEHLLFGPMTTSCPEQVNMYEDWGELTEFTIQQYRMEYAQTLVADLLVQTEDLINLWSLEGDNYGLKLLDGSTYRSREAALNDVFNALFYLERFTLLYKLSDPLGLECCYEETEECLRNAEHIPSGLSLQAITHNLIGFEMLFNNGNGYGFDDYLTDLGHSDLQQEMQQRIDDAKQTLEGQDKSLAQLYQVNPDEVTRIHSEISSIVELLSSDILTVLNLNGMYIDCGGGGD